MPASILIVDPNYTARLDGTTMDNLPTSEAFISHTTHFPECSFPSISRVKVLTLLSKFSLKGPELQDPSVKEAQQNVLK